MTKRDFEAPAAPLSRKELIVRLGHGGFMVEEAQELADKILKIRNVDSTTDFRRQIEQMSREMHISKETVRSQFNRDPQAFLSWQPAPKPEVYGFPVPTENTADESTPVVVIGASDTSIQEAVAVAEAFSHSSGSVIITEPPQEETRQRSEKPTRTRSTIETVLMSRSFYEAVSMVGHMASHRAQREKSQMPSNRQQRRAAEAHARHKGQEPK